MQPRGPTVNRAQSFTDAVRSLENDLEIKGVQASVDQFIEGLRAGGDSLAVRRVGNATHVHRVDNPSLGVRGLSQFAIQCHIRHEEDGSTTFTLIDIWTREPDLPDVT